MVPCPWRFGCMIYMVVTLFSLLRFAETGYLTWTVPCKRDTDSLRWRHNDHDGGSNHQPHGCLLNRLFRRKSKKTSKLRVTGLCVGNSPGTGEFPAQRASYAENVSIWWRHHVILLNSTFCLTSTTSITHKSLVIHKNITQIISTWDIHIRACTKGHEWVECTENAGDICNYLSIPWYQIEYIGQRYHRCLLQR